MSPDAGAIVRTIQRMYGALGVDDRARLDAVLCPDFHAFENGLRMTGRELLDLMSRYYAEGKRYRWSVTGEQVELQGNLGVITYVNQGSITESPGASPVPLSWLETAVLRREASGWRVAFLHSTRARAA